MKKEYETPTCDLRKPCAWCDEPFGRKLIKVDRYGSQYLTSMATWGNTETCSKTCRNNLTAKRKREIAEEKERQRAKADKVMDRFLYPGLLR